jgi:hypothetical protein
VAEGFFAWVAIPLVGGAVLSFFIERLLQPNPGFVGRPLGAFAIHLGLWVLAFCFELVLFQRPYFAACLALATLLLVIVVSNAKYHSLREPFVFQDFEYFTDALRHPRFYLPLFGIGRALLGFAAFVLVLYLGLTLEPSLLARIGFSGFGAGLALLVILGIILLWVGTRHSLPLTFDPVTDLRSLGLLANLWCYGLAERIVPVLPRASHVFASSAISAVGALPNIVVVQSESFFDVRRLYPGIHPALLGQFDEIRKAAVQFGRLEVPAWGANTARTEFAFLSGLGERQLGGHRFTPYRKLGRQGVPTIASFLKCVGYRTVCVHPYTASYYARDIIFPAFGFDEFIDIRDFLDGERCGPYIGDLAVAEKVRSLLETLGQPTFVFVITMENHGPLHLEQVAPDDVQRFYAAPPPVGYEDLTVYLRHLSNADQMIRMLQEHLEQLPAGGWLCWYGDHVPIMPYVYEARDFSDGRTDYFIWGKGRNPEITLQADVKVEDLGGLLLERAGLLPSR